MNILFLTSTRIGDAVLSTGLLGVLIERYPDARITVACGPAAAPLFVHMPNLKRVIPVRKRKASLHWPLLWAQCAGTVWDLVVDLRRSALAYLLVARQRRLYRVQADDRRHRVAALASVLDLDEPPAPRLWISEVERETAAEILPGIGRVLALAPTANWVGKQWRALRFAELAFRLTHESGILAGARVVVLGGPDEREGAEPVLNGIEASRRIDVVGRIDLLTAYAVLRRCSLFIGNDSGLMHIAAAAGIPTVGLFGPSREENYAPWGTRTAVVRTREGYDELVGSPGYNHRTTGTLMDSITVDDVEAVATRLWAHAGEVVA
ncbi:MAG: glycosyl transferase [Rhodospirillaceae bacterium]|nr:glycosyl transferase [Rhodospirillaceae bacterium]